MATRRKRTTRRRTTRTTPTRRRRRRIGAIKGVDFKEVAGLVTGALTSNLLDRFTATLNPQVTAGVKMGVGIALPMFLKLRGYDQFIKGVGAGWVVQGASELGSAVGISGVPEIFRGLKSESFQNQIPVVGQNGTGTVNVPIINGIGQIEEMEENY